MSGLRTWLAARRRARGPAIGDFSFHRKAGRCRLLGPCRAPLTVAAGPGGDDIFGLADAPWPANATGHVLQLRFRSRGFFSAEPAAHIAIGLAGAWHKPDPDLPGDQPLLIGQGLILGDVRHAPHGAQGPRRLQAESFYRLDNRLHAGSEAGPLDEDRWYALDLLVTRDGAVGCTLADEAGRVLRRHLLVDDSDKRERGHAGWWIGHVFSDQHPDVDWTIDLHALRVGLLDARASAALRERMAR